MRLHRLDLTAFGPFATAQSVDFDSLGSAGLFLLHGPTGAGKTSVLDAVCFALYGSVPGARRGGSALRSELADPGTPTEVVLELTVGGRRLEVTRLPEQPRPKKRGTGTTLEKARSRLREYRTDGQWHALSTSHQEIGEEIGQLLGMSREQFCQVVLLPQGEFARFLRADAEARARLLGRLFDTGRFAALEDHLAARRRTAAEEVVAGDNRLLALAHRMAQAAGDCPDLADPDTPGPAGLPPDHEAPRTPRAAGRAPAVPRARTGGATPAGGTTGSAPADGTGERPAPGVPGFAEAVLTWAAVARTAARERLTVAETALRAAEQAEAGATADWQRAAEHAGLQARHATALRREAELAAHTEAVEEAEQRLTRARAAAQAAPALALHDAARREREQAGDAERRARAALPADQADADADDLAAAHEATRQTLGSLAAARRAERRTAEIDQQRTTLEREARADDQALDEAQEWLAGWEERRAAHQAAVETAQEAAARAEHLAARLAPARDRLAAGRRRDTLEERVAAAEKSAADAREQALTAHEHWLRLKERRLQGIAAELAGALREGQDCPVCGSTAHPAPARPAPGHVDQAAEDAALAAHRGAEAARHEAEVELRGLHEALAAATATAGDTPTGRLADAVEELRREHEAERSRAAGLHPAREALAAQEREHERRRAAREHAERRIAARLSQHEALDREQAALAADLADATGGHGSVAAHARSLEARAERLAAAAEAARRLAEADHRCTTTRTALAEAVRAAGFTAAEEVSRALLDDRAWQELQQRVDRWRTERAAVRAELADPAVAAAAELPAVDEAAAGAARSRAAARLRQASERAAAARERCAELDRHARTALEDARRLTPLREEYERVARLAGLAAGTSAENERRMRLESYVLAARLEQVAHAASARLHRMSAGRYTLVHSDERVGARRSGLGLHVVDAWTGRERDTSGLSGGETFFASLALALGLADVVTDEAGGTRLDTLFIDEGFGSLDEQTLDDVLDVLDSLRERDRTVGIVSHVADLRRRIPAQLEVVKDRQGSRVRHRVLL
ncbi:AAA family ATPase [Streptomyces sp. NPDC059740]|uniref:AAA family ATPase n=1 Tax=Streptomyces sp. NPDC059740 TaxID=3346926 RepID=UPI0036492766